MIEPNYRYVTVAMRSGFGHEVIVTKDEATGVESVFAFVKDAILNEEPLRVQGLIPSYVFPSANQVEAIIVR
jgi:hypothetical protein